MSVIPATRRDVWLRLLRSYGLVIALALLFTLVVLLVPSRDRVVPVEPTAPPASVDAGSG